MSNYININDLARSIRKEGESWQDALKRASAQVKAEKGESEVSQTEKRASTLVYVNRLRR